MNIVAISSLGTDHLYVLQQLHKHWPLTAIIRPVGKPAAVAPSSRQQKLAKLISHPLQTLHQKIQHWHLDRRIEQTERQLKADLFRDQHQQTDWTIPVHEVQRQQLHSQETQLLIESHRPDIIITSGCPLLKPEIFDLPRFGTINVHWGISPAYRGEDTLFWPIYHRDESHLGVTIHQIDRSIDGGPVLAQFWPAISADDTEASLLIKAARATPDYLSRVLNSIQEQKAIRGVRLNGDGKLFLRKDRCWYHDLSFSLGRCLGGFQLKELPPRDSFTDLIGQDQQKVTDQKEQPA